MAIMEEVEAKRVEAIFFPSPLNVFGDNHIHRKNKKMVVNVNVELYKQ